VDPTRTRALRIAYNNLLNEIPYKEEIVELLLEDSRSDPSVIFNGIGIGIAVENGYVRILQLMLNDSRVDRSLFYRGGLLYLAARRGQYECFKLLLEYGIYILREVDPTGLNGHFDPTERQSSVFRIAVDAGMQNIVQLLLEDGRANPAIRANIALRTACTKGYVGIVQMLLNDPRVNPSDKKNDALILAVRHSHYEIVRMLLTYGFYTF
jgi:ankyrin repeat protein